MFDKDAMKRTTFTADRKYFIRAEAKWTKPAVGSARIAMRAEVFEGSPTIPGNEMIHLVGGVADTFDLLDALQSAEAMARRYIAALER